MKKPEIKKAEAVARQSAASNRTAREQLARLDRGKFRAVKERAKLAARIEAGQ